MPRTTPCPYCTESTPGDKGVYPNKAGKQSSGILGFFQRTPSIRFLTPIVNYILERVPVAKASILKECGYCNNERVIEDPNDDTEVEAQVATALASKADYIMEKEALLGMGGNYVLKTSGDVLFRSGHTMVSDPSYRIDYCSQPGVAGLAGSQDYTDSGDNFPVIVGKPCNNVKRLNIPPRAGAGTVNIVGGNGVSVTAGSPAGIEFVTSGHCNINAPTFECAAHQVALGSQVGQMTLAGSVITANAGSIILGGDTGSEKGAVFCRGQFSVSGNMQCNGTVASECVAATSMKMPKKKEYIDGGSGTNTYGGPAFWGGPGVEGIIAGLRQVYSYAVMQGPAHPKALQQITSPRYFFGIADSIINSAYTLRPVELVPTGITFTLGFIPGLVWNWPHVHGVPDDAHVHEVDVPNIELYDDARAVRKAVARSAAPLTNSQRTSIIDVAIEMVQNLAKLLAAGVNQLGVFNK
jgi:hypothetical protein